MTHIQFFEVCGGAEYTVNREGLRIDWSEARGGYCVYSDEDSPVYTEDELFNATVLRITPRTSTSLQVWLDLE